MLKEKKFSWNEIYKDWEMMSYQYPNIKEKIIVNRIKVTNFLNKNGYFYGYDWIENEDFDERTNYISNNACLFILSNDALNKGTLTTLKYLINNDNEEILAAIWIYAFISEVTDNIVDNWRGKGYSILEAIRIETFLFLREHEIIWHHAMKKLVPHVYLSRNILNKINIDNKRTVIELAAIEADYVISHYKVAEYDSRTDT